jgi:hypothetical protein
MRRIPLLLWSFAALVCLAPRAAGQTGKTPTVSARQFNGGSATVSVHGVVEIAAEVPLNTQASVADGEMTWLQFGASGSEAPNALITYSSYEVGVSVGKGKFIVTAGNMEGEKGQCSGSSEVTGSTITGHYTCPGLTSYDAATGKMGKVDIEVRFSAKS